MAKSRRQNRACHRFDRRRRAAGGAPARRSAALRSSSTAATPPAAGSVVAEIETPAAAAPLLRRPIFPISATCARSRKPSRERTAAARPSRQQRRYRLGRPGREAADQCGGLRIALRRQLPRRLRADVAAAAAAESERAGAHRQRRLGGQQAIDFDDVMLTRGYSGATRLHAEQARADPVHLRPRRTASRNRRHRQLPASGDLHGDDHGARGRRHALEHGRGGRDGDPQPRGLARARRAQRPLFQRPRRSARQRAGL